VLAIGAKVMGGVGGGGGIDVAKQRQETQGTGTVLGAESAKSESIGRAIENIEKYSSVELSHTRDMLSALVKIRDTIGVVAAMATQTSGLRATALDEKNYGVGSSSGVLGIGASSTSIQDSGIKLNGGQTIGSAISSGVDATGYADILKKNSGLWGIGASSSTSRDVIQLDDDLKKQFGLLVGSMRDGAMEAVKLLGVSTDGILEKINGMELGIDEISFKGLTGAEIQKELEAVFSKVGDDIAKLAVPELEKYQQVGEGYLETLTRVATDYATIDSVMEASGRSFGAVGLASVEARERLIKLAGGLDELVSNSQSFNDNFLNKAEQLAPVQKYVTDQLATMGLQGITTRDQFKNVVLGLDVTTEAGAKQYAALLALADAFAKTHAATVDLTKTEQEIGDERTDLQNKLDELTMTQAQLADKARNAIDAHNRALYDQVQAAQAAKDVLDVQSQLYDVTGNKAAAVALLEKQHADALSGMAPALANATKALWNAQAAAAATKGALDTVSNAYTALQAVVGKEKDKLNEAYTASSDVLQLGIDAATAAVTKLSSLSQDLHSALDAMAVPGQEKAQRAAAQAQIEAALAIAKAGGPLPDADSLKNALSTVSKDASSQFSSYVDYMRDLYRTKNTVGALSGLTDEQLSAEQLTLKTLQAQKTALEAAHKQDLAALDATLEQAKNQTDLLSGIYTSLMTLPQALASLGLAVQAAQANPGVAATTGIAGLYQSLLGRAPDAAGLAFWQSQAASGASLDAIGNAIKSSGEYQASHIPGFATGGYHLGGLRVVGEDGPEIEATGPARIFNASQTRSMLSGDNSDVVAELRAVRTELVAVKAEAKRSADSVELLKRVIRNDRLYASTKEEVTA